MYNRMKRSASSRDEDSGSSSSALSRRLEVVSKQATKVQAVSTRLEWQIDHFEKLMKLFKNAHNLISRQFGSPLATNVAWELHVYPNGKREEDVNNVSFFLRQVGLQVVSKQATKVQAVSTRLEWQIDHFEKLMKLFKNAHNLISRQFGSPLATNVACELHVYPNGKREEDVNNVSFFLRQVGLQRGEDPIMTEFQIYALDSTNNRVSVCRDTKDFTHQQGRGKFQVTREKMVSALKPDGSLLLLCEVEYFPPGSKISVEAAEPDRREPERVEIDLTELLDHELFTDCAIQVGNRLLKAHRCILGLHSQVFRQMFLNEAMLEAQNGIINITDSYTEPVQAMLEFMYTGATKEIDRYPEDILAIAEKYEVLGLKDQCERRLSATLTAKTVSTAAMFADTYNAQVLKHACVAFLVRHHADVLRTVEWKHLKKQRGELANELLEVILSGGNGDQAAVVSSMPGCSSSSTGYLGFSSTSTAAGGGSVSLQQLHQPMAAALGSSDEPSSSSANNNRQPPGGAALRAAAAALVDLDVLPPPPSPSGAVAAAAGLRAAPARKRARRGGRT